MRHPWLYLTLFILSSCGFENPPVHKANPPAQEKGIEILVADSNAITIRLGNTDTIMIEGNIVGLTELQESLMRAYRQKGDTATVVLHVLRETPYGTYAEAQRALEETLNYMRDSVAQNDFNLHYDDLKGVEKRQIDARYHLRVLEKIRR